VLLRGGLRTGGTASDGARRVTERGDAGPKSQQQKPEQEPLGESRERDDEGEARSTIVTRSMRNASGYVFGVPRLSKTRSARRPQPDESAIRILSRCAVIVARHRLGIDRAAHIAGVPLSSSHGSSGGILEVYASYEASGSQG